MFNRKAVNAIYRATVFSIMALAGGNAYSLEQPDYTVLYKNGDIEYRMYEPYIVSETVVSRTGDDFADGNEGLDRLFAYIEGNNAARTQVALASPPVVQAQSSEKISMTLPVTQSQSDVGLRVLLMLPSEYSLETAPVPADERVTITEMPGRLMAVLRYSGRWTERNFSKNEAELRESLEWESIDRIGDFQTAFYNPPFTPPFLRRNEVMVEVGRLPAGQMALVERMAAN